jgi:hypothetical protein
MDCDWPSERRVTAAPRLCFPALQMMIHSSLDSLYQTCEILHLRLLLHRRACTMKKHLTIVIKLGIIVFIHTLDSMLTITYRHLVNR